MRKNYIKLTRGILYPALLQDIVKNEILERVNVTYADICITTTTYFMHGSNKNKILVYSLRI